MEEENQHVLMTYYVIITCNLQNKPVRLLKVRVSCSVVSNSLGSHGLYPSRPYCPWNSSGKNGAGVGSHSLLWGIFATQGLNPGLPHCRQIVYHLSHQNIFKLYMRKARFPSPLTPRDSGRN